MNKKLKLISLLLCLVMLFSVLFTACNNGEETESASESESVASSDGDTESVHAQSGPIINNGDGTVSIKLQKFVITYDSSCKQQFIPSVAKAFHTRAKAVYSKVKLCEDAIANEYEILFGKCNRDEFKTTGKEFKFRDFAIYLVDNKLSVSAFSIYGYDRAIDFLLGGFDEDGLTISADGIYDEYDYGDDNLAAILKNYENPQLDGAWTVNICHRGDITTNNYPENSIPSIQSCIDNKVDVVEIDVRKTADGIHILCHDDTLNRTTNGYEKVSEVTYAQTQQYFLKTQNGYPGWTLTNYKIPTLDEVIKLCENKVLLNLDKVEHNSFQEIYDFFEEYDAIDIAMFKSGDYSAEQLIEWFSSLIAQDRDLPLFSPLIYSKLSEKAGDYKGLVSMIETDREIEEKGIELAKMCNIRPMCLTALTENPSLDNDAGWDKYIGDRGFTAIMTDAPKDLKNYIHGS